jgi:hypothetical protein
LLSKADLLDVEAVRRASAEVQALRSAEPAAGGKAEPRNHLHRETTPRTKEGR